MLKNGLICVGVQCKNKTRQFCEGVSVKAKAWRLPLRRFCFVDNEELLFAYTDYLLIK